MMKSITPEALVLDIGSKMTKVGLCSERAPCLIFPTLVARPKHKHLEMIGPQLKDYYVGDSAVSKSGVSFLTYPMQQGVISDWDDIQKIWQFAFTEELHVLPKDYPLLLAISPYLTPNDREKIAEIMFETFEVPALHMEDDSVLSLLSHGHTSGYVIESGHDLSYSVAIEDGQLLPHTLQRHAVTGKILTEHMLQSIQHRWSFLAPSGQREIARMIKNRFAYVAEDIVGERKKDRQSIETYLELPEGLPIAVTEERYECPETLFNPSLLELTAEKSIHECLQETIRLSTAKVLGPIVLSGGNTLFRGYAQRLQKEIEDCGERRNIIAHEGREYAVWNGGSLMASASSFSSIAIHKGDYEEYGPTIIHQRRHRT